MNNQMLAWVIPLLLALISAFVVLDRSIIEDGHTRMEMAEYRIEQLEEICGDNINKKDNSLYFDYHPDYRMRSNTRGDGRLLQEHPSKQSDPDR